MTQCYGDPFPTIPHRIYHIQSLTVIIHMPFLRYTTVHLPLQLLITATVTFSLTVIIMTLHVSTSTPTVP